MPQFGVVKNFLERFWLRLSVRGWQCREVARAQLGLLLNEEDHMKMVQLQRIAIIVAFIGLHIFLLCAALVIAMPLPIVALFSAIGAVIGWRAESSGGDPAVRALVGSAIGIFILLGWPMTIFARLLGP